MVSFTFRDCFTPGPVPGEKDYIIHIQSVISSLLGKVGIYSILIFFIRFNVLQS